MSEEAGRQTRSQKRALEREAAPLSVEPSHAENESKKPKLDLPEPTAQAQSNPEPNPVLSQDCQSRTSTGSEHNKEQEPDRSPLSLVLPLASQPEKEDGEQTQRQQAAETSSDSRPECNDRTRTESGMDTRSRVRLSEQKASSGMMAAGEVKATIKVEVQTGEQPVDMSTSRGWERQYWFVD